jgi:hypothetical protein
MAWKDFRALKKLSRSDQSARSRALKEFKKHVEEHPLTEEDIEWLRRENIVFSKEESGVKVDGDSEAEREAASEGEPNQGDDAAGEQDDRVDESDIDLNDPTLQLFEGIPHYPTCPSM